MDTDNLIVSGDDHTASSEPGAADDEPVFPPPNVTLPKWTTVYMEPLTVLYCAAFQGLGPLISQYVYYRISLDVMSGSNGTVEAAAAAAAGDSLCNATSARTALVQDQTSTWILHRDILAASGAIISIPLLSSSSDRLGRRLALILPCFGSLAESIVSLCVVKFSLPLICMLIAAFASGLTGGIGCVFSGALAYLADITPAKCRPMRITVLEALTGIGGALACILVGWWIRWQGFFIPHIFCTALYAFTAAFCLIVVPEVRSPAPPQEHQQRSLSAAVSRLLVEPVRDFASLMSRPYSLPAVYALVLCGLALYCAAFYGITDLTVLYSMNEPFCLDSVLIGYFSAGKQAALLIGMLATVGICRWLGLSTLTIASVGTASAAVGDALLGLAKDRTVLWLSVAASAAAACPVPMYRAFVSMVTPADKQGCMFSVFGVLQMLFYLIGNVAFTGGYKATLLWQPGFVFYTVTATLVGGLLLTVAAESVYRIRTVPARARLSVTVAENTCSTGSQVAAAACSGTRGSVQRHDVMA